MSTVSRSHSTDAKRLISRPDPSLLGIWATAAAMSGRSSSVAITTSIVRTHGTPDPSVESTFWCAGLALQEPRACGAILVLGVTRVHRHYPIFQGG
jgi:hypothetical protein